MNPMIKITQQDGKQTVNARDLHAFLEVGSAFNDWIARRIQEYDFQDGKDFHSVMSKSQGGRPSKEYHVSIDMAKELAMVERSPKGKQARAYFIDCEKKLKQSFELPTTLPDALRFAADMAEKNQAQAVALAIAAPKVEFYDTVVASDSLFKMAVAAQVAKLPFGQNTLFKKLREMGALISFGDRYNCPYERYIRQGLFSLNETKHQNPKTGETVVGYTTYVTQKGIDWLIKNFGGNSTFTLSNQ